MSDASSNGGPPAPTVDPNALEEIAANVFVITDRRIPLVPNIGIIVGNDAALVVDTGMGPVNGQKVLDCARRLAGPRRLVLTLTHFHPEHGFGAQVFKGAARIHYNRAQRDELRAKGDGYLGMFKTFGPGVAAALEGTQLVQPDDVYEGSSTSIDLGGRTVELRNWGLAHTAGDQVVWLPQERILFTGDLAEERIFPIFPWFPPDDASIDGARWAAILAEVASWQPAIVVPGHGAIGGAEISHGRARLYDRSRQARCGGAEVGKGCRLHRRLAWANSPCRASRLVGAGMDRLRHQILLDAELN